MSQTLSPTPQARTRWNGSPRRAGMSPAGCAAQDLGHPDPARAGETAADQRERRVGPADRAGLGGCLAERDIADSGEAVGVGGGEGPQPAVAGVDKDVAGALLGEEDLVELAQPVAVARGPALGQLRGQADQHDEQHRGGRRGPAQRGQGHPGQQRARRDAEHDVAERVDRLQLRHGHQDDGRQDQPGQAQGQQPGLATGPGIWPARPAH